MAIEIEHKYLVTDDTYKSMASDCHEIRQGYIDRSINHTVRVRISDSKGFITIKGKNEGDTRLEFEYEIPKEDAEKLLSLCEGRILHKRRYIINYEGYKWEVDEFLGDLSPLTVAEIELPTSTHHYTLPPFIGKEVTGDPKYYNSML